MKQLSDKQMDLGKLIGAAAAGALLMYVLDPERGRARRAHAAHALRDAGSQAGHLAGDALGNAMRRAGASLEAARHGAAAAYARADALASRAGERMLDAAGHAREQARTQAWEAGERIRDSAAEAGERIERNRWEAQGRMNAAAGGARARMHAAAAQARGWLDELGHAFESRSPTLTNSALLGGSVLGLSRLMRRSPLGLVLGLGAIALLARSGGGARLASMAREHGLGMGLGSLIEVEKSIHIDAAPEKVYEAWSNYDNFPRFMSHVSEVRDIGHRRSHWVVKGPAGSEYSWNAVMTEQSRPEHLAWRSEPGSEIEQEGAVSFEPERGGTRVTVRLAYRPPGGVFGHGLARLLGTDPKRQMDDDLARMKSFVERGLTPYTAQHAAAGDRSLH
ncbi:hypothetical protein B0920_03480 [Massilia sp. KIM]|uniref:SRPBCC family protein n=1 Tax=Massilia sp. KIM TaxID=1955422 RepID=UPI00098EA259|nr:SRPBCC family protein [Massilia sp. KIM]OON62526.1 hypothetical protein B0920_03480 [Massilia sp. KIM]